MSDNIVRCSLEDMLLRASDMAEEMFDQEGEITMFWLAETSSGELFTLVTPTIVPDGTAAAEAKRMIANEIREWFRVHDVVRYANAAECWMAPDNSCEGPPSEHPQRKEIISLTADDGVECLGAVRDIVRPQKGMARLGKLSEISSTRYPRGRLTNMLTHFRRSSELRDDEDTVFVTDIPGEALSVMGRRGPSGELFVGHVGMPKEPIRVMCRRFEAEMGGRVEIVTGREAERLVAAVKRAMGPVGN